MKGGEEEEEEIGRASQPQGEGKEADMKARLFQQSACTGGEEQSDGGAAGTSWSWWRVGEVRGKQVTDLARCLVRFSLVQTGMAKGWSLHRTSHGILKGEQQPFYT